MLRIVYARPRGIGWQSVTYFAHLAAELLEAQLTVVGWDRESQLTRKLAGLVRPRGGGDKWLIIAPQPEHLLAAIRPERWFKGAGHVAALVTDSFWVERIPRVARSARHFDQLFIHDAELVDEWALCTGLPVTWVPVGSDVLRCGSGGNQRPVDLMRVGRQPTAWDDDDRSGVTASRLGLRFEGRPPMLSDPLEGYRRLQRSLARCKFTLAFSSRVNPEPYTHPTREWLSYRWVDGVAAGAVVAGVKPRCVSAERLLWPGATVEIPESDLERGLADVAALVADWTPSVAQRQFSRALMSLDWRWRLRQIAEAMDLTTPVLDGELDRVVAAATPVGQAPPDTWSGGGVASLS